MILLKKHRKLRKVDSTNHKHLPIGPVLISGTDVSKKYDILIFCN